MLTSGHQPRRWSGEHGLGLLEILISTAISSVLIIALFTFVARSFTPPRQQYEQGRITEEARIQQNRISDLLRNAVDIDFNGNGKIDPYVRQEHWLQYGGAYEMIFYTRRDAAGNDRLEQIRLWLEGSELKMEVKTVTVGACFTTDYSLTAARNVRNGLENIPLFAYYQFANVELTPPIIQPLFVKRIQLNLVIDSDVQQLPEAAYVRTEVKPRKGRESIALVGSPPACGDCIDNDLDNRVDVGGVLNTVTDPGCTDVNDVSEKGDLECDDGFDNDSDTKIDYQAYGGGDPSCTSPSGTSEGAASP